MHDLEHRLGDERCRPTSTTRCSHRYSELQERFRIADGYHLELKVATVLRGLGFEPDDFDKLTDHLSGGWQMRLALAKLLLGAARPAAARRADQPSRSRGAQLARGVSRRLSALGDPRLARSLLSRRRRHAHRRSVAAHDHRLPLQLFAVSRAARGAHDAAARGEEAAGRGDRARAGVHRSLPLQGDEGGAGAEPHQDAREGRAHRGPARAQAHSLSVSRRRRRAAAWCSSSRTRARRTAPRSSSTASTCTSSAAIASRSSATTAPASRR